jgi:hypothetical protein
VIAAQAEAAKPAADQAKPAEPAKDEAKKEEPKKEEAKKEEATPSEASKSAERRLTGYIDTGYRIVPEPGGNFQTYRSLVNLGEGWKVFSFDLRYQPASTKLFDNVQAQGSGWGGEPYSQNRFQVGKEKLYRVDVDYRNVLYFNNVPSFANPFFQQGVFFNERAYDVRRRWISTRVEFLPGTHIIPFFLYEGNWASGRGVVPLVGAGNEFPIVNEPDNQTRSFRGGVRFEYTKFHFTVEGGRVDFNDSQKVYNTTRNFGNVTTPVNGQRLYLDQGTQLYDITGNSPMVQGLLNWSVTSWFDVHGQFVYTKPETVSNYNQQVAGLFFDRATFQFFNNSADSFRGDAAMPHRSGQAGFELRAGSRFRILETWMTDRYSSTSAGQFTSIIGTGTPSVNAATDRLDFTYNRNQIDAIFDISPRLMVRAGHRYIWGDALTRASNLTGLTPYNRSELSQNVFTFGSQWRPVAKGSVYMDVERGLADKTYFRTSLDDYWKGAARGRYQLTNTLNFNFAVNIVDNMRSDAKTGRVEPGYNFQQRLASAGFFWNPKDGKRISLTGDYTRSSIKTDVLYFDPLAGFQPSRYRDYGHIGTLVADTALTHGARLSFGGSFFKSSGSRPTSYYQPLARIDVPMQRHIGFFADWRYWGYHEPFYYIEGFRAHALSFGFRVKP